MQDKVYGEDGSDILYGQAGNDSLYGDAGNDTLFGGDQNDYLHGGDQNDVLYGDAGHDELNGGNHNDFLSGGEGNDYYTFTGAFGLDRIKGETSGIDLINVAPASFTAGGNGYDINLSGSTTLIVQALNGGGGNTITLMPGQSALAFEMVLGSESHDRIRGNNAANVLSGSAGDDTINGGLGNDTLNGEEGDDTYVFSGNFGKDIIVGSSLDPLAQYGDVSGIDTLDFSNAYVTAGNGYNIDLATGAKRLNGSTVQSLTIQAGAQIENVIGSGENDRITGTAGSNYIQGLAGNDVIIGKSNANTGADTLDGGSGNDTFVFADFSFGYGTQVIGGIGSDTVDIRGVNTAELVNLATGLMTDGTGTITLSGIENVWGGTSHDTLIGNSANNTLNGNKGNDTIKGSHGNDTLNGGEHTDTLTYDFDQNTDEPAAILYQADLKTVMKDWNGDSVYESTDNIANFEVIIATDNLNDRVTGLGDFFVEEGYFALINLTNGQLGSLDPTVFDLVNPLDEAQVKALVPSISLGSFAKLQKFDIFEFSEANEVIIATDANEMILAGEGDDIVFGLSGNDTLNGGLGNDMLFGGEGNDTYTNFAFGYGYDLIHDAAGNDVLDLSGQELNAPSSITEFIQAYFYHNGDDLVYTDWYDSLTIVDFFNFDEDANTNLGAGTGQVEQFNFGAFQLTAADITAALFV